MKWPTRRNSLLDRLSRSLRARGLKWVDVHEIDGYYTSRSLRARGLKCYCPPYAYYYTMSRSLRARGLKFFKRKDKNSVIFVALFTGAWIEIIDFYDGGSVIVFFFIFFFLFIILIHVSVNFAYFYF